MYFKAKKQVKCDRNFDIGSLVIQQFNTHEVFIIFDVYIILIHKVYYESKINEFYITDAVFPKPFMNTFFIIYLNVSPKMMNDYETLVRSHLYTNMQCDFVRRVPKS